MGSSGALGVKKSYVSGVGSGVVGKGERRRVGSWVDGDEVSVSSSSEWLRTVLMSTWHSNIDALESWPPLPDENYRRSHYVVSEWLDKVCELDQPWLAILTLSRVENQHESSHGEHATILCARRKPVCEHGCARKDSQVRNELPFIVRLLIFSFP